MTARRAAVAALAALALLPSAAAVAAPSAPGRPSTASTAPVAVVVRAAAADAAAAAVRAAGGTVRRSLPLVNAVAASVDPAGLRVLASDDTVAAVTPDSSVTVQASMAEGVAAAAAQADPATHRSVYAAELRADRAGDVGITGAGVTVALIDTGVSPVADLAGRIVKVADPDLPRDDPDRRDDRDCVNFSGRPTCDDEYGHGTFMAGLIAGTGAASQGRFRGMAPGAGIVSIKIAGPDGSADVSQVLAGIQWAVSFKEDYRIKVLNLSLGTDSAAPTSADPLNLAVQKAWRAGIAVVVSASNRGPRPGTISKPGDDPLVITVGSVDDRQTPTIDDDLLPRFSGRGPTTGGLAKPDVVAPGALLVSLRAPGSTVEQQRPGGGFGSGDPRYAPYRLGSGTSMSAAVVSGLAALLLQASPRESGGTGTYWSPDRLKHALMTTARPVAGARPEDFAVGSGIVDGLGALFGRAGLANQDPTTVLSTGAGSLQASRGSVRVNRSCTRTEKLLDVTGGRCPVEVRDESTAQGRRYDGGEYASVSWDGTSWQSSQWQGTSWQGTSWQGTSWQESADEEFSGASQGGVAEVVRYGDGVVGALWYGAWR